jgi:hypothetical protein
MTRAQRRNILVAATVVAAIVPFANYLIDDLRCGTGEDAHCAEAGTPARWEGRVFDGAGRPAVGEAGLRFRTQRDGEAPVPLPLDAQGRWCVRWPTENQDPQIRIGALTPVGSRDPRFGAGQPPPGTRASVIAEVTEYVKSERGRSLFHPRSAVVATREPDVEVGGTLQPNDRAQTCPRAAKEPPWYNVAGRTDTRVWVVYVLGVAAIIAMALAAGNIEGRAGEVLVWTGVAAAAVAGLALAVVWAPLL